MANAATKVDELSSVKELTVLDPETRLQRIFDHATAAAKVDPHIPPLRYYRSGIELMRMAKVYMDEQKLEKAYILYVKYMSTVPAKDKVINQAKIREIFPLVEELKAKLLVEYKAEAIKHVAEEKERQQAKPDKDVELPENSGTALSKSRKQKLCDIVVPTRIISEFLSLASHNTVANRETCGILTGKLENDRLLVTHLLIPKQSGSSDSCVTHNEEDIFDYQDQHSLITLGWIHTHPTQTAFLSSVDLHTHCAYQLMMSEAIAIVCAPKYHEVGYFMLTPDHGLNFVACCRATGFHPHPNEKSLYMLAQHCKLDPTANLHIVDLRKK